MVEQPIIREGRPRKVLGTSCCTIRSVDTHNEQLMEMVTLMLKNNWLLKPLCPNTMLSLKTMCSGSAAVWQTLPLLILKLSSAVSGHRASS